MTENPERFPLPRLLVISGAVFASNSTEFLPAGVLPGIATELAVPESQVGLLVSVFALTVAVSTLPLTALTRAVPRKTLMVVLLTGLAITNFVCAIAPEFWMLMTARVFGGVCHGLFWAVTGPYASYLVRRDQLARALAVTNSGTTLGFILGVPIGTAIGVAFGWRAAFAVMGVVVLAFVALVVAFLPAVQHRASAADRADHPSPHKDPTLPAVLALGVVVVLAALGQYSFYTYIAPWLLGPGQIPAEHVSTLLFVFGLAGAAGLVVAGTAGDRWLNGTMLAVLGATAVAVVLMYFLANGPVLVAITVALWGLAFAGFPSLVHAKALHAASRRIHDFTGAIVAVSFNAAISVGAIVGGLVIDTVGASGLPWAQFAFTVAALVAAALVMRRFPDRPAAGAPRTRAEHLVITQDLTSAPAQDHEQDRREDEGR